MARKISRGFAALMVRDIEAGIRAAVAAGHPAPPVELRYIDGLSRAEASALMSWARGIPEIAAALRDRRHAQHREIAAMKQVVDYFLVDHPAREDGTPRPWQEPISEPLLSYVTGYRQSLDASELSAAEAAAMLDYSLARGDLAAARFDRKDPRHETVKAELAALAERAAAKSPTNPADAAIGTSEGSMTQPGRATPMAPDALRTELKGLSPGQRAAKIDQLFGSLECAPGAAQPSAGARIGPIPPAELRASLHGLTGAARTAKLTELFSTVDSGESASGEAAA